MIHALKDIQKHLSVEDKNYYESSLSADSRWWVFFKKDMFGRNYWNLNGRASRREWWAFTILSTIYSVILNFVYTIIIFYMTDLDLENPKDYALFSYGGLIISFYVAIPSITLSFRRFHDINMSAWWGMLVIPMLFLPFFRGDRTDNRFGLNIYDTIKERGNGLL